MKKLTKWIKKNYFFLLPIIPIALYVFSMWNGNYDTYGDTSVPLYPNNNIEKSLYLWELTNHGMNVWRYMYLLWQLPFYLFSLLGIPGYVGIKIYMVCIMAMGFVFSYLFFITLFKNTKFENKKLGIFCSFIFTLCASSVDILPTTIFLTALPLCSYFVIKYLDTSKIRFIVFFALAVNYSYFAHLPQAKYFLVLLGELFFVLLLYLQTRNVNVKDLAMKLFNLSLFTILLNAFILTPFLYEAFRSGGTYSYYTQNVTVYNGDAELHTARLQYITRFFTSSLASGDGSLARFLGSQSFTVWTFLLLIIAFFSIFLVKTKKEKTIVYLCILGFVLFMFLAKGSNPPFGEVYKFLLFNVPVFKVFRTTSMSVIGATIFIAILVTISMYYLRKKSKRILFIVLFIHSIIFAPIFFGVRLVTYEENGQIRKGAPIPKEYFQIGNKLDRLNEDSKVLSLPLDDSYTYKDWPYTGQSIMGWITKKPYIHGQVAGFPGFTDNLILQRMNIKEACFWTAMNNIGYTLYEKDSRIPEYSLSLFHFSDSFVTENAYLKLEKVTSDCSLPHIYAATDVLLFVGDNNSISSASRFVKNNQDIVVNMHSPVNTKKDFRGESSIVIEAYPEELRRLSDNVTTKNVFDDVNQRDSLDFWTYSFTVPEEGSYQVLVDKEGDMMKESKDLKEGKNLLDIPISKSANLIDFDSFVSSTSATPLSQVIKKWEGDALYLLSLTYKAEEKGNITFSVHEKKRQYYGRSPYVDVNAAIFSKELPHASKGVYEYHGILRSDINALESTVTIAPVVGVIEIESIVVEKVQHQKVFITKLKDENKIVPKIVAQKINPTRYVVDVKNAQDPFNLVFSETFNSDWKAFIQDCEGSCYPFQELTRTAVPENQHIMVNGYANAWNIRPEDSRGKKNYTVIIEYWPQRLFYIGGIISFLTLLTLSYYGFKKSSKET